MSAELIFRNDADEPTFYRLDAFPAMSERDALVCKALMDLVYPRLMESRA